MQADAGEDLFERAVCITRDCDYFATPDPDIVSVADPPPKCGSSGQWILTEYVRIFWVAIHSTYDKLFLRGVQIETFLHCIIQTGLGTNSINVASVIRSEETDVLNDRSPFVISIISNKSIH